MTSCYFFLSKTTFAKDCDFMDDTLSICSSTEWAAVKKNVSCTLADTSERCTCEIKDNSDFEEYLSNKNATKIYPKFECARACGPYVVSFQFHFAR